MAEKFGVQKFTVIGAESVVKIWCKCNLWFLLPFVCRVRKIITGRIRISFAAWTPDIHNKSNKDPVASVLEPLMMDRVPYIYDDFDELSWQT